MNNADYSNIHRYLDTAFAGIDMTPETQDLKEELRGNLGARVAELQSRGMDASTAASTAVDELGDIRELVDSLESGDASDNDSARRASSQADAVTLNHVRPRPGFVIRTVLLSLVVASTAALVVLGALGIVAWPAVALTAIAVVFALAAGVIVTDSLVQETSQHYRLPWGRAASYGVASFVGALGIAFGTEFVGDTDQLWLLITGILLAVGSLVAFIALGVTQTNRMKPWARALQREYEAADRFSQDPVLAARFGIYTIVIWVLAFAAFVVLSITIGFVWSWLALLAGLTIFMITLARMGFSSERKERR
jgi:MFS family permease